MTFTRIPSALILALALAAAACVPRAPEQPESTPTPSSASPSSTTPPPPLALPDPEPTTAPVFVPTPSFDNWMDAPQTPGDWFYRQSAGWSEALFGEPGTEAKLIFRCRPDVRTISIIRQGRTATAVPMRIRTESRDRVVDAVPGATQIPTLIANVSAADPLLDAIAFSKGRFAVEVPGLEPLYVPSWPEITRAIEDCR